MRLGIERAVVEVAANDIACADVSRRAEVVLVSRIEYGPVQFTAVPKAKRMLQHPIKIRIERGAGRRTAVVDVARAVGVQIVGLKLVSQAKRDRILPVQWQDIVDRRRDARQ